MVPPIEGEVVLIPIDGLELCQTVDFSDQETTITRSESEPPITILLLGLKP